MSAHDHDDTPLYSAAAALLGTVFGLTLLSGLGKGTTITVDIVMVVLVVPLVTIGMWMWSRWDGARVRSIASLPPDKQPTHDWRSTGRPAVAWTTDAKKTDTGPADARQAPGWPSVKQRPSAPPGLLPESAAEAASPTTALATTPGIASGPPVIEAPAHAAPGVYTVEPTVVEVAIPGGRWWEQTATRSPDSARGSGPSRASAPPPSLSTYETPSQVVQCRSCGGFRLDVTLNRELFTFHCLRCRDEWTWRDDQPWPTTTLRPPRH
jgi:hypothetical protein